MKILDMTAWGFIQTVALSLKHRFCTIFIKENVCRELENCREIFSLWCVIERKSVWWFNRCKFRKWSSCGMIQLNNEQFILYPSHLQDYKLVLPISIANWLCTQWLIRWPMDKDWHWVWLSCLCWTSSGSCPHSLPRWVSDQCSCNLFLQSLVSLPTYLFIFFWFL